MKNQNYQSLSCLKPYNSGFDGFQSTEGSDFSFLMSSSINGYDLESGIDNTTYQPLNFGNETLDVPSQFSCYSPVVPSPFMPPTIDNLILASPPPLMDYQCGLPGDFSFKPHSLLAQPCELDKRKHSIEERVLKKNNIISNISGMDASKTGKKRKALDQLSNVRQAKFQLAPVKRSQKLSDKITALQELVSPYGKTDTASVLQEACIYIKIIHQELRRLSISYSEARPFLSQFQGEVERQADLRSRGLCLVPTSIMKRLTRTETWGADQHQPSSRNYRKPRNI